MADDQPQIQIDSDWKKQAQEEKKRLQEEQAKSSAVATPTDRSSGGAARSRGPDERELPTPAFSAIVQSILTQAFYYLGELSSTGYDQPVNLDMAKYQVDLLGILEGKTSGRLTPDEQKILDTALHDARSRFVSVAQQYI